MARLRALPEALTIYQVGPVRELFLKWLKRPPANGRTFKLDGSAVAEVDGAGLQLLLSLVKSLSQRQCSLQVVNASPALCEGAERLGACAYFGLGSETGDQV